MHLRLKPYSINKDKYLLDDEYDRLMEILEHFEAKDLRNVLMLKLALATGARAKELLNLRVKDLDPRERSVYLFGLKGSNDRELPIKKSLFQALQKLCSDKKPEDLVFAISYPRLIQIWQLYRPTHKKFHSLRHTFAIRLYKKTRDIRLLQVALGHRNIANTMVYADYVYSQQELRKLIL